MKILITTPVYLPYTSGISVYASRLAQALVTKGHSVSVLTYSRDNEPETDNTTAEAGRSNISTAEPRDNIKVIRIKPMFKFQRGGFSPELKTKFKELIENMDTVNIHAPFLECGPLAKIAKKHKKKVILTYHCDIEFKPSILTPIAKYLTSNSLEKCAKLADTIVVNSLDYMKTSPIYEANRNKIVEISPPIDNIIASASKNNKTTAAKSNTTDGASRENEISVPISNKPGEETLIKIISSPTAGFKTKYNLPKNKKIIGYLGRIVREKDLETLIRAINIFNNKNKNNQAHLVLSGDYENIAGGKSESEKENLEKLARDLDENLEKNITFTGHLNNNELPQFFRTCDIFILPSSGRMESFGMVQIEAMLCGTPVIATDTPGIREPIKKTNMGKLFPRKDSEALANAIQAILTNRQKYIISRDSILKIFDSDTFVLFYEKLLQPTNQPQ